MRSSWASWVVWLSVCCTTSRADGSVDGNTPNTVSVFGAPATVSTASSCQDFVALMPPQSDPAVVLQVLSEGYIEIEQNFVYQMEKHSSLTRDHLYMLCVDDASAERIESALGIRCVRLNLGKSWNRGAVWMLRVKINRCLLLAGTNVIVSDADAVWLNDPFEDMKRLGVSNSNIVGQRDLRPRDVSEYWGVTLCFGFVFFRAGGVTMSRVLDTTATIVKKNHDDQKALNLALFALGLVWDEEGDMACQSSTGIGTGFIGDNDESFVVSLLPHSTYPRWCEYSPVSNSTVVAHCLSTIKGKGMSSWMRRVGAWHDP